MIGGMLYFLLVVSIIPRCPNLTAWHTSPPPAHSFQPASPNLPCNLPSSGQQTHPHIPTQPLSSQPLAAALMNLTTIGFGTAGSMGAAGSGVAHTPQTKTQDPSQTQAQVQALNRAQEQPWGSIAAVLDADSYGGAVLALGAWLHAAAT